MFDKYYLKYKYYKNKYLQFAGEKELDELISFLLNKVDEDEESLIKFNKNGCINSIRIPGDIKEIVSIPKEIGNLTNL